MDKNFSKGSSLLLSSPRNHLLAVRFGATVGLVHEESLRDYKIDLSNNSPYDAPAKSLLDCQSSTKWSIKDLQGWSVKL